MRKNFTKLALPGILCLLLSFTGLAQTYTLDWGSSFSPSWSAGATSGTATNVNGSGRNVSVNMAFTGSGNIFLSNYPQVNNNNSSASVFQVQNSTDAIQVGIDLANKSSYLTITFTFSAPVQNLNFGISDIDGPAAGSTFTYLDSVRVSGTGANGNLIPATVKYNNASTVVNVNTAGQASANEANGANVTSTAQNTSAQDGTVFFSFTGQALTSVTIVYTSKSIAPVANDPSSEAMAIGNLKFDNAVAPVTANINDLVLGNTLGAVDIADLTATDDESIASYTLVSLPAVAAGVLQYFNGTAYVNATAGLSLTTSQAASLRFDPAASFSGSASFSFSATDNRGLTSNTSTFTIPIEPVAQPTANNIVADEFNSGMPATSIPPVSAAAANGTIASYTIQTIPAAAQGILYLCNTTCAAVIAGQSITPADASKLRFDPAADFLGNATFSYFATSNSGTISNTASYTIPVSNRAPVANTILSQIINNTAAATQLPALTGADADGTIGSFAITSLPTAAQGILYLCNPSCAAVTAGQTISPANAANLQFDPAAGFTGTVRFNYTVTDNSGNTSQAAVYNIPVKGAANINLPPYADNASAPPMLNSYGNTQIPGLAVRDADGSITSYTIESIPAVAQGLLSYCSNGTEPCTGTVTNINGVVSLSPAQMATLKFDPAPGFTGTAVFTYHGTDNSGNKSNTAFYSIPVSNIAPVAGTVITSVMSNTYGQTALPQLSAFELNSIASYTITSIPAAGAGTLSLCNPGCVAVTAGQAIAAADIAKLSFDPAAGFTGNADFSYTVVDNNGASASGSFIIPVTSSTIPAGLPPVAVNKTAAAIANTASNVSISALTATDGDGTISSYTILSIPASSEGVLSLCSPSCTPVSAGQVISSANAANLSFTPAAGYEGQVFFNFTARDNSGKTSNVAAYAIPVTGSAPRSGAIQAAPISPSAGPSVITSLNATDADGTIASYTITSLPPASAGILSLCNPSCTPVSIGQVISAADAGKLSFNPVASYKGYYTQFNFVATDNSGNISNMSSYTIPMFAGSTLPVKLVSFTATAQDRIAALKWTTESEIGFSRFVIERSLNGSEFHTIGSVAARGGNNLAQYIHTDDLSGIASAKVYYRLRMVDLDGSQAYSHIAVIHLQEKALAFTIAPNPVRTEIMLQMAVPFNTKATISIIDQLGQTIYTEQRKIAAGTAHLSLGQAARFANGSYMVQITTDTSRIVKRLLIQH
ncbi:MAG TPA: Ig-like domain-containing protein [Flavisolibacter sp.]|nr:Ig-like domain-containing protein [Flavisolibacter sp.]